MIDKEEYQLIVDAAVLYYLEGKIQSEIAKTSLSGINCIMLVFVN